ncbi:hypothetical protein HWV62_24624 [Athelia sp. TMB]|nr:hypothetical protein HWV62_24624 [Athelia sp. TMB]
MPSQALEATRKLPDDVLLEIFTAFLTTQEETNSCPKPILLGSVCARWRTVTLSTSLLWTNIRVAVYRSLHLADAANLIRLFSARSGKSPLQIFIIVERNRIHDFWEVGDDEALCEPLISALADSAERWQHVYARLPRDFIKRIERALDKRIPWPLPMLEQLDIDETSLTRWPPYGQRPLPVRMFSGAHRLRHVTFGLINVFGDIVPRYELSWSRIQQIDHLLVDAQGLAELMVRCPNLLRCDSLSMGLGTDRDLGINHPLRIISHGLLALDIFFHTNHSDDDFFDHFHLPSLRDVRLKWQRWWGAHTLAKATSFLSKSFTLQRLVLRLTSGSMPASNMRALLRALPGIEEFEYCHGKTLIGTPTVYSKELIAELTLTTPTPLLPNLRVLSLIGMLDMDPVAFTAMVRSRVVEKENGRLYSGVILQSLYMHILDNPRSLTVEDLEEIRAILGNRADIRTVIRIPVRSPAFPELL